MKKKILKIAVVMDDYKRPTFRKILQEAGYGWVERSGFGDGQKPVTGVSTFFVSTEDELTVAGVVRKCNAQAAKDRPKTKHERALKTDLPAYRRKRFLDGN